MSNNRINAASFIETLERAIQEDANLETYWQILLKDMSEILDDMSIAGDLDNGPVEIKRDPYTHHVKISTRNYARDYNYAGMLFVRIWLKEGMINSYGDHPASIAYYDEGPLEAHTWYKDNKIHRAGGNPTVRAWHRNGKLAVEEFREDGVKHRTGNLPAYTHYDERGRKTLEEWAVKTGGSGRTDGGPTAISYDENGNNVSEYYG